ncbi:hypothetical protein [Pontibacillus salipaludis]|uniref:Uncharacterized protein n=1 Tax=Pontibacillus salipaludis TaxID=1697394 RepID=A0ABQ1QKL0_9BACI|nr:hypothetical protein [Pontibacillus salipaludis]GGD29655.1 hypothetical protein GCM10011389_41510 [Pontibacillus salipaludis]
MLKKFMYLSFLVAVSFAAIMPINTVSAANLSSETVVTTDNVHQVLEYLNVDASNYNDAEIEKKVESTPEVTVGEIEEAVTNMQQAPEEVNVEFSSTSSSDDLSVNKLDGNNLVMQATSEATGTKTVSRTTLQGNSYRVTYNQTASYSSTPAREAWEQAYGSSASVSDSLVDGVNYSITSESYSAKVENPGYSYSNLNQKADIVVTGYLFGVKVGDTPIYADLNWDTGYILPY